MTTRALLYGRFQPFHKGHLAVTRWAFETLGVDEIVFLVGMASENYTARNPFTAGERIEMIRLSFRDEGLPLDRMITATIETLEVSIGRVYYVLSYVPRIDFILTRNPGIARIFRDAGFNVVAPPLFNRDEWRGEYLRSLMARRDPAWKRGVTPSTAEFIESIDGVERLASLLLTD
ncbi:MAG: nicotinamide-nucleotide adenylyltransferase [Desulfurococcales archaeon]|nr:nicotinamide-nucleotide adenylyltransferase [Desulfurococcales archaeon]